MTEYAVEKAAQREIPPEAFRQASQLVEKWEAATPAEPRIGIVRGVAHVLRRQRSKRTTAPSGLLLQHVITRAYPVRRFVAECRQAVFGRAAPPFAAYADALAWLKMQQRKCPYSEQQWHDRCVRAWERAVRQVRRTRFDWRASLSLCFEGVPALLGIDTSGRPFALPFALPAHTPKLYALWRGIRDVAKLTGWREEAALAYILAGVIPAPSKPQVSYKVLGMEPGAGFVTVRLWPWHLNAQGMGIAQQEVQRSGNSLGPFKALAALRLTESERHLLDLIADQGPPPPGRWKAKRGARKFYFTRMAQLWKQSYGQRISTNALRKAWDRLRPRYESAFASILTGGDQP